MYLCAFQVIVVVVFGCFSFVWCWLCSCYWFECLFLVGCIVELWGAYWLGDLERVVLVLVFVAFGLLLF